MDPRLQIPHAYFGGRLNRAARSVKPQMKFFSLIFR